MAVELLDTFRAADLGMNVQPLIIAVKGTDGKLYVQKVDPATGEILVRTTITGVGIATEATQLSILADTNALVADFTLQLAAMTSLLSDTATLITNTGNTTTQLTTANTKISGSFVPVAFDYVGADTSGATEDVYTYKTGGSAGTTVKTVTVTYASVLKQTITSVGAV